MHKIIIHTKYKLDYKDEIIQLGEEETYIIDPEEVTYLYLTNRKRANHDLSLPVLYINSYKIPFEDIREARVIRDTILNQISGEEI